MSNEEVANLEGEYLAYVRASDTKRAEIAARGTAARLAYAQAAIAEQVRKGVALLDRELPSWRTKIDADLLDMTSGHYDILGQLFQPMLDTGGRYNGYQQGLRYLELNERDNSAQAHGFVNNYEYWDHETFPFSPEQLEEFDALLTAEWNRHVLTKPAAPAPQGDVTPDPIAEAMPAEARFLAQLDLRRVAERVRKGAALLDQKCPGWREKINPGLLDMHSGEYCILGQVFRGQSAHGEAPYYFGINQLGLSDAAAEEHGFNVNQPEDDDDPLSDPQIEVLLDALYTRWRILLTQPRGFCND